MKVKVYTENDEATDMEETPGINDAFNEDRGENEEDSPGTERIAGVGFHAPAPVGMKQYIDAHGWHFSKKLYDYAVANMKRKDASDILVSVPPMLPEQVDEFLDQQGVSLNNASGYNAVYVANMARSDFYGSSVASESRLAKFIKDYIDDANGYDGLPLMRYYADCLGKGLSLPWAEVI